MTDSDRFDKFTERSRKVLSLAQEEARRLQHNYIGTEHLLLGMVREGEGVAGHVLATFGVELNKVRAAVEFIIGRGDRIVPGEIGLTPRAKKVIELSVDEARLLNHHYIGTEHLLLGLIREGEGIAVGTLKSLGVNLTEVRDRVIQVLSQSVSSTSTTSSSSTNRDSFDKFTEPARKVLSLAQEEARRLQHNYIGTEHLLLGFVGVGEGTATNVLHNLGVELPKIRSAVEFIIGHGDHIVSGEIGLTPRAKKVIELSVDEALRLNHHYIGTEHLLLGLIREGEGIAAGVLEAMGVNLEKTRTETIRVLLSQHGNSASTDRDRFDKFTERSRKVLSLAQEEARRFQHNYIGTEHLLLGMVREGEGVAGRVLATFGVELNKVRAAVEFIIGRGDRIVPGEIGLTPRAKNIIELAVDEARLLNHHYIGTEHLLLGLIREGEGIAAGILESFQVNLEMARTETIRVLASESENRASLEKDHLNDTFPPFSLDSSTESERFRKVLSLAQEEARRLQHNYIGTEHALLGIMREEENVAAVVLTHSGVALNKVRSAVEFIIGRGDRIIPGEIGHTPRLKKVIELATDEAHHLNHEYLGPAHLLLGLLREGEGIAMGVLESLGVDLEKVRLQTIQLITTSNDQSSSMEETGSPGEITLSYRMHLFTLPFCHVTTDHYPRTSIVNWLQAAAATGWSFPLALAHDLGLLLRLPASQRNIARPSFLPSNEDTSAYIACLERMATHPLVRELSSWSPPLADSVLGIVLARLIEGLEISQAYRLPGGSEGARFLHVLEQEIAHADPATLWERTPLDARPSWNHLLSPDALAHLERNLQKLNREEVRFLARYGPGLSGSPDPRMLLDLLALTGLPDPARLALSQTLTLLPHVTNSTTQHFGGIQTYPEGGYEGLARQGSLESLLPGENVYTDEVFLHRVLNREALYYGRERPRTQRREVAYLVGQLGWGLGGDGQVLVRALLLALSQAMQQRGYQVFYSLAGATLSSPATLEKPEEIGRLLCVQERGSVNSELVLQGVLAHLRNWRSDYLGRHVFWVLGEDFDADTLQEHTSLYRELQAESEQQVWYVRLGQASDRSDSIESPPATAQRFGHWQIVESGRMWSNEEAETS